MAAMLTETGINPIEGLLIDAVGTLLTPAPGVAEVYAEAARRQGVELDRATVKARFARQFGADEVDELRGPLATDEPTEHRRWRRIVASVLPEVADPDRAFEELWDHFGRPEAWRMFDDVAPALAAVREGGRPMRIASNFDARLRGVLRGLPALAPWADSAVISSEVGYRKPHPAFFHRACAALDLPPERVLFVGDDPENDERGPRRAGLRAALIDREGSRPRDGSTWSDLAELVAEVLGSPG
jgi:putative hydrolase of the HAD superfamily